MEKTMRMFAIATNYHTITGLRLVGIDGALVHTPRDFSAQFSKALIDPTIAILFIEESLMDDVPKMPNATKPIIATIPATEGIL